MIGISISITTMLGVWPRIAIQDMGADIGMQYTADSKRGKVPRGVLLVEPVEEMVVLAKNIALH